MSGPSAKRRSARVLTTGSVGGGLIQKVKKSLSSVKLSSMNKNLKDGGPISVDGQLTSMDMDGEASDVDPKIVKTQVKVAVKKSFALDINLSAVKEKSAMAKTQVIKKLFSGINGFGGATILSKFEEIIRSTFTSSESMKKAVSLARNNNIIVNSNLKKQRIRSDWTIVIKEIPMNTPKEMIVAAAVVKFAKLEQAVSLAARWSFLIGKDSVCVTMAVDNHETWASKDQFRAFLFTLPIGTTAHNLEDLLKRAGGKTCVINWLLKTGNRVCCAVVCFDSDEVLESAFCTEPIFDALKSSKFFIRPANLKNCLQLAKLYAKKNVPISRPVAFGGKSWAQVVSVASVSHGFHAGSGSGSPPSSALSSGGAPPSLPVVDFPLSARLALLECSVELLSKQISDILSRLDNVGSAPLAPSSQMASSVVVSQFPTSAPLVVANSDLDFDMAVDNPGVRPTSFSPGVANLLLGLSSSKVLTFKVGGLESKLVALDISVGSILAKLDQLCAGSGSLIISSSQ
ncbi:hypothetical protein G9A89_011940 [Geosiphon pyriformis]|nr:hypothetical protein G9A89_011940 [Geosiphon pyriformis]